MTVDGQHEGMSARQCLGCTSEALWSIGFHRLGLYLIWYDFWDGMLHNRESNRGTPGHHACYLYRQVQVARPVLNFLWHVVPSARPMRNSDGVHNRQATTTNHQTSFFPEVSIFTGVGRNPNTSSARPRRRHTCLSPARLAQSAERKALNLVVVGSSPTVGVLHGFPNLCCLFAKVRL